MKAQLVTLIVLLILAGISLSGLFSEKGLFKRTEDAGERYREAKARETLETVLLVDGQYEKNINPDYNQNEFLDELIKNEIPGSKVIEDIAIVDGFGYELDRSVPKIGHYVGKEEDLIFPKVTASIPILASDYKTATFTITAKEEIKGINRIEIWLAGEKIDEFKYDNVKTEIIKDYTVNRNGVYTIKAYAELMGSAKTTVEGVIPTVEFMPNGSIEWKKEHTTKITVRETMEKVASLKYKWTDSIKAPEESEFTEVCTNNSTITKKDVTGIYYLWVLLETETGKKTICGSEAFYFDNEAPTVELVATPLSETSFKLIATASDNHSGVAKYEFYVDEQIVDTQTAETVETTETTADYNWLGNAMAENKKCYVIVYDLLNNSTKKEVIARTKLHSWEVYNITETKQYSIKETSGKKRWPGKATASSYSAYTFDASTGSLGVSGSPYTSSAASMTHIGRYYKNGNTVLKIEDIDGYNPGMGSTDFFYWVGTSIEVVESESSTISKGTFTGTFLRSTNENAYEKDGIETIEGKQVWTYYIGLD